MFFTFCLASCTRMCRPLIYDKAYLHSCHCLLPCSLLPSTINVIVSRGGMRQRKRGWGGQGRQALRSVTRPQQLLQPIEFSGITSVDVFFLPSLLFLFCSCLAMLDATPSFSRGPYGLSSSSYFAWIVVFERACVRAGGGFGKRFGSSFDQ